MLMLAIPFQAHIIAPNTYVPYHHSNASTKHISQTANHNQIFGLLLDNMNALTRCEMPVLEPGDYKRHWNDTTPTCAKHWLENDKQKQTWSNKADETCITECSDFQTVRKHECLALKATITAARTPMTSSDKHVCRREQKRALSLFIQLFIREVVAVSAAGSVPDMKVLWSVFCPQNVGVILKLPPKFCKKAENSTAKILMMGDGISRQMVGVVCKETSHTERQWSDSAFYYKKGADGVCTYAAKKKIGFLHFFGSRPFGPYPGKYSDEYDRDKDHYVDTQKRVVEGVKVFSKREGTPSVVVLNFVLGDIAWNLWNRQPQWTKSNCPKNKCCLSPTCKEKRFVKHQKAWQKFQPSPRCYKKCYCECETFIRKGNGVTSSLGNATDLTLRWSLRQENNHTLIRAIASSYKKNMHAIIRSVQKQLPPSTAIIIHTVPKGVQRGADKLYDLYNQAIRELAGFYIDKSVSGSGDGDVILVDWAAMLSGYDQPAIGSKFEPHRCYLRDDQHPRDLYLLALAFLLEETGALWHGLFHHFKQKC
jgi:hypothetical protein